MKLLRLLIVLLIVGISTPNMALATTCAEQGGICAPFRICWQGDRQEIPTSDCTSLLFNCCPRSPNAFQCGTNGQGVSTAIGCIPQDFSSFVSTMLTWGVGLAGGVLMIILIIAAITIITASGDPKKVQAGKELIVSAIGGIILIIFSVLIMNVIGVNILHLDELGFQL